ncbi:MAG: type II toxin-antitoxin system RelE/ParE family toxin [Synergistaceae bacterium]|nr:type II toxin-antitoxin system RelE/ParE family toxin [Candidatus Equadaptatus faecalis]
MYEVIFYHLRNGESPVEEYLDDLKRQGESSKTARINRVKILSYMSSLAEYGTRVGQPVIKHIEGDLWELRPLRNRIFFFTWKENRFVLLHYFIKKSQKTPKIEIEKAKSRLKDFLDRSE